MDVVPELVNTVCCIPAGDSQTRRTVVKFKESSEIKCLEIQINTANEISSHSISSQSNHLGLTERQGITNCLITHPHSSQTKQLVQLVNCDLQIYRADQ